MEQIKTREDAQSFFETVKELDYNYEYSNGCKVSANLFRNENGELISTVWEASSGYSKGIANAELIWQDSEAINKALRDLKKLELSKIASSMGRVGGAAKTEAKSNASRSNGKLGGRPKKPE